MAFPKGKQIQISSYNPISYEMNILPVMEDLLENDEFSFNHSFPVVIEKGQPMVFREYKWGDILEKSSIFTVYEPTEDKKQVYP